MSISDAPAYKQLNLSSKAISLEDIELKVIRREERYVYISVKEFSDTLKNLINPGLLVELYTDSNTLAAGITLELNRELNEVTVLVVEKIQQVYKKVKFKTWWNLARPHNQICNKDLLEPITEQEAILKAFCQVPIDYQAGSIRWTLYVETDGDLKPLVNGNDFSTPGICFVRVEGYKWKPANYTLKAKRVDVRAQSVSRVAEFSWSVTTACSRLTLGGLEDSTLPLNLS